MNNNNNNSFHLNNFDSLQIGVASPEKIREWSHGEVTKNETINYRTQKPEAGGLFCEKIFGPTRSWECHCGKYKKIKNKGIICDKCGVEVTDSKVRRERMGHVELVAPVAHIWYYKGTPSRISLCTDIGVKELESILYFSKFVVIDPGITDFVYKQVIDDTEYRGAIEKYGANSFVAKMGAEGIKDILAKLNLDKEAEALKEEIANTNSMAKRTRAVKRLDVLEAFRSSGTKPEWMILEALPVIPPELRPMVPLDGGRFATSDLNDLYRRVINRNNRLKKIIEMGSPEIIVRNEKRMLQEAVDALIDNGRRGKAVTGPGGRELKSLTSMLKGKQGRFRQNLLGKRVDYSGRSVIVVGPELKMYECGLPKEMAIELFKPFVIKQLVEQGLCNNIKNARKFLTQDHEIVWDILEEVIKDHPVLLNRAPTLHRLGIQAFQPVLVEGRAIKLHPLACGAFNADFDGDQMAVHVPLSIEAQAEARFLMLSTNNILKLSDGNPVVSPSQDMVIGSYYLTIDKEGANGEGKFFRNFNEALMAYQLKEIDLQAMVNIKVEKVFPNLEMPNEFKINELSEKGVRVSKTSKGVKYSKILKTTVGRYIFNEAIPQDIGFVKRELPEEQLELEINFLVGKSQLSQIVDKCFKTKGATATSEVLDKIKSQGYKYSTIGAITTSVFDMHIPSEKYAIVHDTEDKVAEFEEFYNEGLLSEDDRYNHVIDAWKSAKDKVDGILKNSLGKFNPIYMMANSGARGSMRQISQLCGMRGLVADPSGKTVELPVKSNYREGLSVLEYFISSHGGRKGLADTALKTADSGYLTRRLVDVAQDVIINDWDCGDTQGTEITAIIGDDGTLLEPLADRIFGRYSVKDVIDPNTGEVLVGADEMISKECAKKIQDCGIEKVRIRSALSCKLNRGVCSRCYGANMASGNPVKKGEAVGVIAAQSIGEPGTQLTMRTFHTGGVATSDDITQGLPRVEELFEVRKPKGVALLSDIAGKVTLDKTNRVVRVTPKQGDPKDYKYNYGQKLLIGDNQEIEAGTPITKGSIYPQDILRTRGVRGVQEYLTKEVQSAYRASGVHINDKHTEIIIRQMLRKVRIESQGSTDMLPGELVDIFTYEQNNEETIQNGGVPATAKRTLLSITKASLAAESFLSAASFQETAKVLTEAAIKNKKDRLVGLKENIILGKIIPAGTGLKEYRNIEVHDVNQEETSYLDNEEYVDSNADMLDFFND